MKVSKAIEILVINNDHNPNFTDADRREAHQLGIEALKEAQRWRAGQPLHLPNLLPGETPEGETKEVTHEQSH